jgi:hypothetical protein
VKICEIRAYTQQIIGGGKVGVMLIKLGPLRCLIPTRMEHGGECDNRRSSEAINDMICGPCLILDVDMELLQVCGPLLMEVVLQFPMCLYELQRLVIIVDDCLLSHNLMFPLEEGLHNGIHFLFIGRLFSDDI